MGCGAKPASRLAASLATIAPDAGPSATFVDLSLLPRVRAASVIVPFSMTDPINPESVYCPTCGTRLVQRTNDVPVCPSCGRVAYADPKFAAAAVIPLDGGIVLVQRAIEPGLGMWSFPSGYVNRGEMPNRAVEREVREECGLIVSASWVVGIYSTTGRPVVLGVYNAEVLGGALVAGDETLASRVFPIDDLPKMAFAYDQQIVEDWREGRRMRGTAD